MCEINETTSVGCNANNMEAERVNKLLEGAVHGKSEALALAKQTLDAAKSAGMELIRVSDYFYEFRNVRAEDAEAKCADYERLREVLEKLVAWNKQYPKSYVMNMGMLEQSEIELDAICEEARTILTPAAPCATTSSEIVAARKAEESSSGGRK